MALVYTADDEPNICKLVAFGLEDTGYKSAEFTDGTSLLAVVRRGRPDAMILGWMVPPPDGLTVCRILRENPEGKHLPTPMLTTKREELDHVLGLETGADDYVVKPLSMKELATRVHAVLYRSERAVQNAEEEILTGGGLTVDIIRHAAAKDGELRKLMAKESDLLVMLMKHRGRMMTRDTLLDKVWGVEYYGDTRTVDVHVCHLRQKIEEGPESPRLMQMVCDVGYRLAEQG